MAKKDTVFIDVVVDDKGTTKRVAVNAKKLGAALDEAGNASTAAGKGARTADRNLKGLSKQSSNTTKNFSKMAQGMTGGLVPAYAILASNVFAITTPLPAANPSAFMTYGASSFSKYTLASV